jgi:tungstate transport system permease protein
MDLILEGLVKAFQLIVALDPEVLGITWLSLKVSGLATFISVLIGISTGMIVALTRFPGKKFVVSVVNTGMGLPRLLSVCSSPFFCGGTAPSAFWTSSIRRQP